MKTHVKGKNLASLYYIFNNNLDQFWGTGQYGLRVGALVECFPLICTDKRCLDKAMQVQRLGLPNMLASCAVAM